MSSTETWTVGKLLTWTTEFLKKSGSQSPRLDAEVLLAHARECKRIELYTSFDAEPSSEVKTAFREMVKRRADGTPVAYLVGYKEFYSLPFEVNPDVLIPRPETEHLVVEALDRAKQLSDANLRIADVGTGSGVIAIIMAKQLPQSHVTAIDISPKALAVAERNALAHAIAAPRLTFLKSDLLAACDASPQFELILSNPPYISNAEFLGLDPTVRDYEPQSALLAGPDGDELIRPLISQAQERLVSGGFLIFEFSPMLAARIADWVGPSWTEPHITKDIAGHARVLTLQKL